MAGAAAPRVDILAARGLHCGVDAAQRRSVAGCARILRDLRASDARDRADDEQTTPLHSFAPRGVCSGPRVGVAPSRRAKMYVAQAPPATTMSIISARSALTASVRS